MMRFREESEMSQSHLDCEACERTTNGRDGSIAVVQSKKFDYLDAAVDLHAKHLSWTTLTCCDWQ